MWAVLQSVKYSPSSTVTLFPDGHFDMSALDRLEKIAGISIFNKLAPKFLNMASALHFHESTLDNLRKGNSSVEGAKSMFRAWLSSKHSPPPTWKVLLEMLQAIEMGELAQEIEKFFSRTPFLVSHVPVYQVCTLQLNV